MLATIINIQSSIRLKFKLNAVHILTHIMTFGLLSTFALFELKLACQIFLAKKGFKYK